MPTVAIHFSQLEGIAMIDVSAEQLLTFSEAARLLPAEYMFPLFIAGGNAA